MEPLRYRIDEAFLRWRKQGPAQEDWRLSSQVRFMQQKDNGAGYYDYDRLRLTQCLFQSFQQMGGWSTP